MQRQDDFHTTRDDMLLFIARLVSLADLIVRIVACGRPVDDRLLLSFRRSEYVMRNVLGGILGNVDMRGDIPALDQFILFDEPADRHAELLRLAASFRQIAVFLALILSMSPRAFRSRLRGVAIQPASDMHLAGKAADVRALSAHVPPARPRIPP